MNNNVTFDKARSKSLYFRASMCRSAVNKAVCDKCLNDNKIVQIIFALADKTGVQPNTLDMSFRHDYPQEIQSVLDMLNREFPAVKGFKTDREAFDTIKSRYLQSSGELQQFVDSLAADFIKSKGQDVEDVRESNDKANEYGTDV